MNHYMYIGNQNARPLILLLFTALIMFKMRKIIFSTVSCLLSPVSRLLCFPSHVSHSLTPVSYLLSPVSSLLSPAGFALVNYKRLLIRMTFFLSPLFLPLLHTRINVNPSKR